MEKTKPNESYKCVMCNNTYLKGRSDEEAYKECLDQFGLDPAIDECRIICDDCFIESYGGGKGE
jgi:fructose-1,6-bisphosphatase